MPEWNIRLHSMMGLDMPGTSQYDAGLVERLRAAAAAWGNSGAPLHGLLTEAAEALAELIDQHDGVYEDWATVCTEREWLEGRLARLASHESFTTALDLDHVKPAAVIAELQARMAYAKASLTAGAPSPEETT